MKAVMEDRPYLCSSTRTFLGVFHASNSDEKSLMYELFLHHIICEHVSMQMVVIVLSYMGDFHLRDFLSIMKNKIEWHLAIKSMEANEENMALWVWEELGWAAELRWELRRMLIIPGIKEPTDTYRRIIANFCLNQLSMMKS